MANIPARIRGGPALTLLVLLTPLVVTAGDRYNVQASLTPVTRASVSATGALQLDAHLSNASAGPDLKEGGGFALMARLSQSTRACFNDTIYRDGFNGNGM